MSERSEFLIRVRAGGDDAVRLIHLRRFLKGLLRHWGLVCTSAVQLSHQHNNNDYPPGYDCLAELEM